MPDVTALGELLIDFNFEGANDDGYPVLSAHPGGAIGNFLAALAKRGVSTAYITKVGDDAFGHMLKKTIEEAGIDTRGVLIDPAWFTTLAFVALSDQGEETMYQLAIGLALEANARRIAAARILDSLTPEAPPEAREPRKSRKDKGDGS